MGRPSLVLWPLESAFDTRAQAAFFMALCLIMYCEILDATTVLTDVTAGHCYRVAVLLAGRGLVPSASCCWPGHDICGPRASRFWC